MNSLGMLMFFLAVLEQLALLPLRWIVREFYLESFFYYFP